MIILKLKAGLGNQMFQYAHARALALRSGTEAVIDLSWFDNQPEKDTKRSYGLSHFNIASRTATREESAAANASPLLRKISQKLKRMLLGYSDYVFHPSEARPRKDAIVEGYWNSEKYFADFEPALREEFTLRDPLSLDALGVQKDIELAKQQELIPVLVHVRRGDYVTNVHAQSFHGAKGADYYLDALKEMDSVLGDKENRIKYYVSSDDIEWVRQNVTFNHPVYYMSNSGIKDYEEILLMSLCSHFIISNSTFSWWGAWLSAEKDKIVIGPKLWVNDPKIDTRDVLPSSWIRI